jgi:pimeloyl-ACP methyl ester carboxylesterase
MELQLAGGKAFAYTAAHALEPAKPTVVFVHGAGLDHSWWGLQSRYFGYHGYTAGRPGRRSPVSATWRTG